MSYKNYSWVQAESAAGRILSKALEKQRLARELKDFRHDLWLRSVVNLSPCLAVAGALAAERKAGREDGWGDGWDAGSRYFGVDGGR